MNQVANNVISFSLWREPASRDWANYLLGVKLNAEAKALFFPDWEMRVYVHKSAWKAAPQLLQSLSSIIVLKDIPDHIHPLLARYLPLWEQHNVVIVRDLDSILSMADAQCVTEWLGSSSSNRFLIYREYRMGYATMGGGFGCKPPMSGLPDGLLSSQDWELRDWRDKDEILLDKLIGQEDAIVHSTRMDREGHYFFHPSEQCLWICTNKDAPQYAFLQDSELEQLLLHQTSIPLSYLAERKPIEWIR